jgi:hypothetical protein
MNTYHYFEACGYVSEPFTAADLDAAEAHVLATFRNPSNPDFDGDDGGIVGTDADGDWECLLTIVGDTDHNPDNADRLSAAIDRITYPNVPTPGAP